MKLELDRMSLDEVSHDPFLLASAIHTQLDDQTGPVPVYEIACALDIEEIREERLISIEGALMTTPERGYGAILINEKSSYKRRRFTVGHELFHFLNPAHQPVTPEGFLCSNANAPGFADISLYRRQEAEADCFAIELLAPPKKMNSVLKRPPDLRHVLDLSESLRVSKEAVARRYVDLHVNSLAVMFSKNGIIERVARPKRVPSSKVWNGHPLPDVPTQNSPELTSWKEVDASHWIKNPIGKRVSIQTLRQVDGYAMTLMHVSFEHDLIT